MLPSKDQLTICFAHVAYRLRERFLTLATGIESFEVRDGAALEQRIGEADVLVISGLWRNDLLPRAKRLRFIQSIGAGTDQFSREALKQHGVRLASARGVNARAVAEHVMALMLALARRRPEARDNQARRVWRGMIGDLTQREDELGGKTLLIVGLGQIGGRLAQLAKAFDMRVIGIRRDPRAGAGHADAVHAMSDLKALLTSRRSSTRSRDGRSGAPRSTSWSRNRCPRPRRCGPWSTCSSRHTPQARPAATRTMCSRSCRRISRGSGAARPSC
jgi:phosphoglycerate dehydrogenase-like enzyme